MLLIHHSENFISAIRNHSYCNSCYYVSIVSGKQVLYSENGYKRINLHPIIKSLRESVHGLIFSGNAPNWKGNDTNNWGRHTPTRHICQNSVLWTISSPLTSRPVYSFYLNKVFDL